MVNRWLVCGWLPVFAARFVTMFLRAGPHPSRTGEGLDVAAAPRSLCDVGARKSARPSSMSRSELFSFATFSVALREAHHSVSCSFGSPMVSTSTILPKWPKVAVPSRSTQCDVSNAGVAGPKLAHGQSSPALGSCSTRTLYSERWRCYSGGPDR
jgi:hypothetical protein